MLTVWLDELWLIMSLCQSAGKDCWEQWVLEIFSRFLPQCFLEPVRVRKLKPSIENHKAQNTGEFGIDWARVDVTPMHTEDASFCKLTLLHKTPSRVFAISSSLPKYLSWLLNLGFPLFSSLLPKAGDSLYVTMALILSTGHSSLEGEVPLSFISGFITPQPALWYSLVTCSHRTWRY